MDATSTAAILAVATATQELGYKLDLLTYEIGWGVALAVLVTAIVLGWKFWRNK